MLSRSISSPYPRSSTTFGTGGLGGLALTENGDAYGLVIERSENLPTGFSQIVYMGNISTAVETSASFLSDLKSRFNDNKE